MIAVLFALLTVVIPYGHRADVPQIVNGPINYGCNDMGSCKTYKNCCWELNEVLNPFNYPIEATITCVEHGPGIVKLRPKMIESVYIEVRTRMAYSCKVVDWKRVK